MIIYAITASAAKAVFSPENYAAIKNGDEHQIHDDELASKCEPFDSTSDACEYLGRHGGGWYFDTDANTHWIPAMPTYMCWDESGTRVEISAESAVQAAKAYVADGDWGDHDETIWVRVRTAELATDGSLGDTELHTVAIEPTEPACSFDEGHDWQSPHELVGGLEENPGVFGHGGGVLINEVCAHCGCRRITDTWAQDPLSGEQGLRSVEYREANEQTLEWVNRKSD